MVTRVKPSRLGSGLTAQISRSVGETSRCAAGLARRLQGGDTVLVSGPVGSGKTVFIKALARVLGVRPVVRSPSFVVLASYPVRRGDRIRTLVHIDCYRLKRRTELETIGVRDYLNSGCSLVAVEWPDQFPWAWPGRRLVRVSLKPTSKTTRRIVIKVPAGRA